MAIQPAVAFASFETPLGPSDLWHWLLMSTLIKMRGDMPNLPVAIKLYQNNVSLQLKIKKITCWWDPNSKPHEGTFQHEPFGHRVPRYCYDLFVF